MGTQWCFSSWWSLQHAASSGPWSKKKKKEISSLSAVTVVDISSHKTMWTSSSNVFQAASSSGHNPVCNLENTAEPGEAGGQHQCLTWHLSVGFRPQGHVVCCLSLGCPKGRLVWLMFPNMIAALSVGTFHWGQKVSQFTQEGSGYSRMYTTANNLTFKGFSV